jgi:oligoribonuclease NrnB/cAMP/cGMP phosphodiesterase (DHH superfamily)
LTACQPADKSHSRYNSIGNTDITKNTRREAASRISIAIDTTSRQLANVETDLNQLRYQNPGLGNEDVAATLKQMEDERMALANANRLLEELRLKASTDDAISPTDAMNITFGANNSGVQTGTINGGLNGLTFSFGGR